MPRDRGNEVLQGHAAKAAGVGFEPTVPREGHSSCRNRCTSGLGPQERARPHDAACRMDERKEADRGGTPHPSHGRDSDAGLPEGTIESGSQCQLCWQLLCAACVLPNQVKGPTRLASVAAAFTTPALSPFIGSNRRNHQRGSRISPPKARQSVQQKPHKECHGEIGADHVLCTLFHSC
jgi:hypothetical protein